VLRRALPKLLAGEENVGRAVRWVHVVDVPEPEELLRGGELVLSTGLGPGHDPAAQRRFIRSLAEQQAAGLLVEIGYTYKDGLPRTLVAEAAARGLPLIATHRPTRFVDITEAIHGALVDRRLAMLRRAQEAGNRMTSIVLERGDPDALLVELADEIVAFGHRIEMRKDQAPNACRVGHPAAVTRGHMPFAGPLRRE